jgi:hypothetical protein
MSKEKSTSPTQFKEAKDSIRMRLTTSSGKVPSEAENGIGRTPISPFKYMKQDLVWYAAYDEDINSKVFIEKLQRMGEDTQGLLP